GLSVQHSLVLGLFLAVGVLLVAVLLLARHERLLSLAASGSLLCWILLGTLAVRISDQPRSTHHIVSLVESGGISLKTPLRWHGRLRDEPTRLPWGYGYEIDLSSVDYENNSLLTSGGLRLSFTTHPSEPPPPEVHAGDRICVVTQAKLPQIFRDDGAFDRRAYLAQQNVDLVATLRAPELLEREAMTKPTPGIYLARARRKLRDELDDLFASDPQASAVLRAMLLGDRTFVDRNEAADFQKTGVFHVLVVAGLHVGALAAFL